MYTKAIIQETIGITVVRMTTKDDLNSTSVKNLLESGRLQDQLLNDLKEAFSKYLRLQNVDERLSKVFAQFAKIKNGTLDDLTELLAAEFDAPIKEGFGTDEFKWIILLIFISAMVALLLKQCITHNFLKDELKSSIS